MWDTLPDHRVEGMVEVDPDYPVRVGPTGTEKTGTVGYFVAPSVSTAPSAWKGSAVPVPRSRGQQLIG